MSSARRTDPPEEGLSGRAWQWAAAHSDAPAMRLARRLVHGATRYVHAENHDIATNGEARLLRLLGSDARVIFDVGACAGDWTVAALARCPAATVYAFELSSSTRRGLEERLAGAPRVRVMVPGGLAAHSGVMRVKYYPLRPEFTSLHDYPHDEAAEWTDEQVVTGDEVVAELGLDRIDLLKLDVEGAEMEVLQGLRATLEGGAIRAIQFEYGYAAVYSHALLADFYRLLEPLGYRIGRLGRDGVAFTRFRLEDENFFGPNFVAVRGDDSGWVNRLRRQRDG